MDWKLIDTEQTVGNQFLNSGSKGAATNSGMTEDNYILGFKAD
jgi:hypothetical protein